MNELLNSVCVFVHTAKWHQCEKAVIKTAGWETANRETASWETASWETANWDATNTTLYFNLKCMVLCVT